MLLVPSDERRRSGSNYTPRKLTEPIVRKTLEPVLANLGEKPKPAQLLDLKICDPAMGSGAFLVEACRQLADHLVVAWQRHGGMPPVPPDEDELLLAKRLVAQKCLYGVDKNPMAADLAKLSLWLATLAKDHPFTFLDHSLRSGDSLVGLTRKQIASLHWEEKAQRTTVTKSLEDAIRRAAASRRDILEGGDFLSPALKAQKLEVADDALSRPRLIGDAVIAAFFSASKPKDRQKTLDRLAEPIEDLLSAKGDYATARARIADLVNRLHGKPRDPRIASSADALAPTDPISHPLTPFHWDIEFPEVFGRENPGFDAIVGNPPFLNGTRISTQHGDAYRDYLLENFPETTAKADLVAFVFRRASQVAGSSASLGLIATMTIGMGDTRPAGLGWVTAREGYRIYCVTKRIPWPGDAAVTISTLHLARGLAQTTITFNGRTVERVSCFLLPQGPDASPAMLASNRGKCFSGPYVMGAGFLFDDDAPGSTPLATMKHIVATSPQQANGIRPYINGEDFLNDPRQLPSRHVIYLGESDEATARSNYPELMDILEKRARLERQKNDPRKYPRMVYEWWKFWNPRHELMAAMAGQRLAIMTPFVATHLCFGFVPATTIVGTPNVVFCSERTSFLTVIHSRVHESWVRFLGSTMEDRQRYTPSDCFETFPFPENFETDPALEAVGNEYYEYRAALMVENDEGLTKTYNRFHDPAESNEKILRLRELHAAMDRAVLVAYGWNDVPTACGFALDWLDLDDDELADTLASAPDDIRERIESADYFFPDAAAACRFQSHIKQSGKGKLPWRYRWPDEVRDDVLARLLALNAARAELERLTGLPGAGTRTSSASPEDIDSSPAPSKAKRAKGAKKAARKPAPPSMFPDEE